MLSVHSKMMERFVINVLNVHCKMMENEGTKAGRRSQILDGISCFFVAAIETMAESDLCEFLSPAGFRDLRVHPRRRKFGCNWSRKPRDHIFNHHHKTERKLEME